MNFPSLPQGFYQLLFVLILFTFYNANHDYNKSLEEANDNYEKVIDSSEENSTRLILDSMEYQLKLKKVNDGLEKLNKNLQDGSVKKTKLFLNRSRPINNIIRTYNIQHLTSVKQTDQNPYEGKVSSYEADKSKLALSPLGTPVMQDITFESVTYTDFITKQTITTKPLKLINVLLTVTQAKKIITTEIQGRNGTVKEYIGMDDYEIQINGILTGTNGSHPADQIISLHRMLTARVTTPVTCDYLLNLGIHNIVIKDFTFQQDAGGYSTQNFSITALSDEDVTLQLV